MQQITIFDLKKRKKGLSGVSNKKNSLFYEGAHSIINSKRVYDIKRFIESASRSENEVNFPIILELYNAIIENGTISEIESVGNIISEEVVHRVRDMKATQALIRRRLTMLQNKSKSDDKTSSKYTTSDRTSVPAVTSPNSTLAKAPSIDINDKKNEVVESTYNKMLKSLIIYENCDYVLNNYNTISMRFNLDNIFTNANYIEIYDIIVELCWMIDVYTQPDSVKLNIAIEVALYGLEKNHIEFEVKDVVSAVSDYFLFKNNKLDIESEIKNNVFLCNNYKDYISSKSNTTSKLNNFIDEFNEIKQNELNEKTISQSLMYNFIDRLYSPEIDGSIDGTPVLLRWIRNFLIPDYVSFNISIYELMQYIAHRYIFINSNNVDSAKDLIIKRLKNEIKNANRALERYSNEALKYKIKKYIECIDSIIIEIKEAYFIENDIFNKSDENIDYDVLFNSIEKDISDIIRYNKDVELDEKLMFNLPKYIATDELELFTNSIKYFPEELYVESYLNGVYTEMKELLKESSDDICKIMRFNALYNSFCELRSFAEKKSNIFSDGLDSLPILNEVYGAISLISDSYATKNELLEASFINSLKAASLKIKNALSKLSDKEKTVSKNIDVGMNNLGKKIERSLTTDNRESVIKGSILPSASKLIKLCMANAGLLILHQPIAALISTLGYIGVTKGFKAKERQMIIDEIEIELDMCEKYINIAEQKNDMKALKQLLFTKKELERQLQRVKYKMRVEMGKKYYDSKSASM